MPKQQTNIRLSLHSKRQLRALAHKLGLSEGQLVMLAIDRLARDEGLIPRNQLWQHKQSSEVYAVRTLGGEVVEAAGPLARSEYEGILQDGFEGSQEALQQISQAVGDYGMFTPEREQT